MKTPRIRFCPAPLALMTAWLAGAVIASAQAPTPAPAPAPKAEEEVFWERRIESVEFNESPLTDVVRELADLFPEINFVVNEGGEEVTVSLLLRQVSLDDLLKALAIASDGRIQGKRMDNRLVALTHRGQRRDLPTLRAFNLSDYFAGRTGAEADQALKDLENVLEISWHMLKEAGSNTEPATRPNLSIHRQTKLLIVVGQPQQLEVIAQIVSALQDPPQRASRSLRDLLDPPPDGTTQDPSRR